MARTELLVLEVDDSGMVQQTEQNSDVSNGNFIDGVASPIERLWIECRNSGASTRTLTLITGATYEGKAVADTVISIAAGVTKLVASLSSALYGQPSTSELWIDPEHTDLKYRVYSRAAS